MDDSHASTDSSGLFQFIPVVEENHSVEKIRDEDAVLASVKIDVTNDQQIIRKPRQILSTHQLVGEVQHDTQKLIQIGKQEIQHFEHPFAVQHHPQRVNQQQNVHHQMQVDEQQHLVDEQQHPADKQQHQVDEQQHPADKQQHQVDEQQHPADKQQHQVDEQQHPADKQQHSVDEQQHPFDEQQHPVDEQQHPVDKQQHPADEQPLPEQQLLVERLQQRIEHHHIDQQQITGLSQPTNYENEQNKIENKLQSVKLATCDTATNTNNTNGFQFWMNDSDILKGGRMKDLKKMEVSLISGSSTSVNVPFTSESTVSPRVQWMKLIKNPKYHLLANDMMPQSNGCKGVNEASVASDQSEYLVDKNFVVRHETTATCTSLLLTSVERHVHSGLYVAQLQDEFGRCECLVSVLVVDKPGPPKHFKFSIQNTSTAPREKCTTPGSASIQLSWESPDDDGGDEIVRYMIERQDPMDGSWSFCCSVPAERRTAVEMSEQESGSKVGCDDVAAKKFHVHLTPLLFSRSASFRVAAENVCGVGKFVELSVADVSMRLTVPGAGRPWFIRKLPLKLEIVEGNPLELYCSNAGNMGSKPLFVRKLPQKFKVTKGNDLEIQCGVDSIVDDEDDEDVSMKSDVSTSVDVGEENVEMLKCKIMKDGLKSAGVPCAPTSLSIALVDSSAVQVSWSPPKDAILADLTGYVLEKREEGSHEWHLLSKLPPDANSCELANMCLDKGYFLRVSAANSYGVGPSKELEEPIKIQNLLTSAVVPEKPSQPWVKECSEGNRCYVVWETEVSSLNGDANISTSEEHKTHKAGDDQQDDSNFLINHSEILHYIIEKREIRGPHRLKVCKKIVKKPPVLIEELQEGVEYEFRVFARNSAGISPPSHMSKPYFYKSKEEQPAKFVSKLKDVIAVEGHEAVFECSYAGNPHPKVRWFKNFCEVFDGHKHKIESSEDDSHSRLTIRGVVEGDCGEVECRVFNELATTATRAYLTIHSSAKLRMTQKTFEGLYFTRGSTMKVRVPINGRPSPEVQWMKNGTLVEANERISFEQDDTSATMLVRNCSRGDVGTYCIKIRNYMGFDEASFPVNVTDRPGSVSSKPQVLDVTDSSCVVAWSPSSDDGGSPILEYIVEECEKVAGRWKLAGSTTFNRITVTGLKKNSQYAFRVKARNVYGTSEESQASDWVRIKMTSCQNFDYDKFVTTSDVECSRIDVNKLKCETALNMKYKICEEISRGQFGMMHRVIEKSTGRNYLVRFSMSTSAEKLLMRREVDITNLLTHQHQSLHHRHQCGIIYLHDAFETDGEIAFVYEFLSGPDLITKLLNVGHTEVRIINYMRQICQAVAFMHVNDIVNLDIRPETIFFTTSKSENLKLTNFGTSQKLDPDRSVRVVYPSISFCPPELLTFEPVSFYSDVWNLGVLAYLLVSGTQLFESAELDEAYNRITSHDEVAFDEDTWTDVSNYCQNWISRCLRREPVKRISLVEALAHPWLNGEAEAKLSAASKILNSSDTLMSYNNKLQKKYREDVLPIGRLAYEGAAFLRVSQDGIALEREIVMELPDHPPQVITELNNTDAYEGTLARFKCKFHGRPEPTIRWFHEERQLLETGLIGKYSFWTRNGLAMLNINSVQDEDVGLYVCEASNKLGACSTRADLNVQKFSWKKGDTAARRSLSRDNASTIDSRFDDTKDNNNKPTDNNNNKPTDNNNNTNFALKTTQQTAESACAGAVNNKADERNKEIPEAEADDGDSISSACSSFDRASMEGDDESATERDPPTIIQKHMQQIGNDDDDVGGGGNDSGGNAVNGNIHKDSKTLVDFVEKLENMRCVAGDDVTFKCVLPSDVRVVDVTWSKDGLILHNNPPRMTCESRDNILTLTLNAVTKVNEGRYKVEVTNAANDVIFSSAHLSVSTTI